MKVLLQVDDEGHGTTISGVGTFELQPGEPLEVENDFIADKVREQLWWCGVVEVPITRERNRGITYNVETAIPEAQKALLVAEQNMFKQYREAQLERMKQNFPAVPPEGRVLKIIDKHKINLLDHGLRYVGTSAFGAQTDNASTALATENAQLKGQLADLSRKVDLLVNAQQAATEQKSAARR